MSLSGWFVAYESALVTHLACCKTSQPDIYNNYFWRIQMTTVELRKHKHIQTENLFQDLQVEATLEYVPTKKISQSSGFQVRILNEGTHPNNSHLSSKIIEDLEDDSKAGAIFPAIIVRRNINGTHSVIDGRHRHYVFAKTLEQIPAYVLDNKVSDDICYAISSRANDIHGVMNDPTERKKIAIKQATQEVCKLLDKNPLLNLATLFMEQAKNFNIPMATLRSNFQIEQSKRELKRSGLPQEKIDIMKRGVLEDSWQILKRNDDKANIKFATCILNAGASLSVPTVQQLIKAGNSLGNSTDQIIQDIEKVSDVKLQETQLTTGMREDQRQINQAITTMTATAMFVKDYDVDPFSIVLKNETLYASKSTM
jgi:hypothetical protein